MGCLDEAVVAPKVGVTQSLHNDLSKETKEPVLARLRQRCRGAGRKPKKKRLTPAVELLGYQGKAAIRAHLIRTLCGRCSSRFGWRPFNRAAAAGRRSWLKGSGLMKPTSAAGTPTCAKVYGP